MSKIPWARRLAMAWRALQGDEIEFVAAKSVRGNDVEKARAAPAMNSKAWAKAASEWNRQSVEGSVDAAISLKLLDEFERMRSVDKVEALKTERGRLYGFGKALCSAAKSSLDKPSEAMAWELTRQHAKWIALSGEPVLPEMHESAAIAVSRSSWWEAASQWSVELSKLAGGAGMGDEACFSMAGTAHLIASKILLGVEDGQSLDERSASAWRACCDFPWPDRVLDKEVVVWTGRKWQDCSFSRVRIDKSLEELGATATWADLLRARIGNDMGSKSVLLNVGHGAWQAMSAELFASIERRRFNEHADLAPIGQAKAPRL